jgi:hypothetical protein
MVKQRPFFFWLQMLFIFFCFGRNNQGKMCCDTVGRGMSHHVTNDVCANSIKVNLRWMRHESPVDSSEVGLLHFG